MTRHDTWSPSTCKISQCTSTGVSRPNIYILIRFGLIVFVKDDFTHLRMELWRLQDEGSRLYEDLVDLKISVDYSQNECSSDTQMIQYVQETVIKLQNVHDSLERNRKENSILSSLSFLYRTRRHEITKFRWILDSALSQWHQEHGDDIFWIFGRSGSGKSTLFKFLAGHPSQSEQIPMR